MNEADRAFWSAMAQVLPVLALALVLEARAVFEAWRRAPDGVRALRRWQIGFWGIAALGLAVGLIISLGVLRADSQSPAWLERSTLILLALAVVAVVVLPFLNLAASQGSTLIARLRSFSLQYAVLKIRIRRKFRRTLKVLRERSRTYFEFIEMIDEVSAAGIARFDRIRARERSGELILSETEKASMSMILADVERYRTGRLLLNRVWRARIVQEHNMQVYRDLVLLLLREQLSEISRESRKSWETYMRSWDASGVPARSRRFDMTSEEPDDGGFFSTSWTFDMVDFQIKPYWVRDPDDFRVPNDRDPKIHESMFTDADKDRVVEWFEDAEMLEESANRLRRLLGPSGGITSPDFTSVTSPGPS